MCHKVISKQIKLFNPLISILPPQEVDKYKLFWCKNNINKVDDFKLTKNQTKKKKTRSFKPTTINTIYITLLRSTILSKKLRIKKYINISFASTQHTCLYCYTFYVCCGVMVDANGNDIKIKHYNDFC